MPYHPGSRPYEIGVFIAVDAVLLLGACVLIPWFFSRRNTHPIKGRLPRLVVAVNIVLQIW